MISNKCNYALRALLELAKREGGGPATIVDIAQAQHIPARFLEAILRELKQAGLTESVRGKKGGYILARPARAISLGEVIRLLEGPFFGVEYSAAQNGQGASPAFDVFRDVWKRAEGALADVYDATNFADLADEDLRASGEFEPDYAI